MLRESGETESMIFSKRHILLLTSMAMFLASQPSESLTLVVNLKGFRSDQGAVEVALFDQPSAFPKDADKAIAKQRSPISRGVATVTFRGLKPGDYAVASYHDVNNNGKMDTNFMGIPKEPTGASNDAKGRMGPPSFKDARLSLTSSTTIEVSVQ
jgi:uncharacterized protein (DUF2141 family)